MSRDTLSRYLCESVGRPVLPPTGCEYLGNVGRGRLVAVPGTELRAKVMEQYHGSTLVSVSTAPRSFTTSEGVEVTIKRGHRTETWSRGTVVQ